MIIFLNKLIVIRKYLDQINSTKLEDIIWVLNGQVLEIPKEVLEEFKYTGLSNASMLDFIELIDQEYNNSKE